VNKEEDIKRVNEEIAARFNEIQNELKSVGDIAGLLETLFEGMEQQFEIPFVWLTLINDKKAVPIIEAVESSDKLKSRLNLITKESFSQLLPEGVKLVLINKKLKPYYRLFPSSKKFFVKSMAIVPLLVRDEIIGSWNIGDASVERYSQDMETSLLQKFAESVSRRLTELVDADS
jgi:uncharacterized protein YigA (DUF484 family)